MIFIKLLLSSGRGKEFVTKWLKDKLYLKFGARVELKINDISAVEEDGKIHLKLDIDADCPSDDFYTMLEKLAK